ncbi:hypothetical protein BKA23_2496 [Rudaeicoccus suwonensis]|uniref:Bacterial Ig-like domain-containing protein n=2 Tax=Rudaeicoccus suwonensis TaxID=657409 RepID=A0A561E3F9_9MICO|nr:hypothetical protein BKA23_2496 [Rudaeicoccus suwonensis]
MLVCAGMATAGLLAVGAGAAHATGSKSAQGLVITGTGITSNSASSRDGRLEAGAPAVLRAALRTALTTHRASVVTSLTTATSDVTALPDGTFRQTTSAVPVRVRRGSTWVSLNTTLARTAHGIAPVAASDPVTFSAGGTGPLITLGSGAHTATITLPDSLPAPVLSGTTATYRQVAPGIDVVVSATTTGYTETLVVHSAAAASSSALTALMHPSISSSGTTWSSTADGAGAVTGIPNSSFALGAGEVWDSTTDLHLGPIPSATDPSTGHITALTAAPMTVTNARRTLQVAAQRASLAATGVHYPLFVQPDTSGSQPITLSVFSAVDRSQWSTGTNLPVGYCTPVYAGCGRGFNAASFFQLGATLPGTGGTTPHVDSASVSVREVWNGTSAPTGFDLDATQSIHNGMNWPGPAITSELGTTKSAAGSNGRNFATITFSNTKLASLYQTLFNHKSSTATFGLTAPLYGNSWKRFDRGTTDPLGPSSEVVFSYPPANPSNLTIVNSCRANSTNYVNSPNATLRAQASDGLPANGASTKADIKIVFYVKNSAGKEVTAYTAPATTSNTPVTWTTPALADGSYTFVAEAVSVPTSGPTLYSGQVSTSFIVQTTAPAVPTVTSQSPAMIKGSYQATIGNVITLHAPGALAIGYSVGGTPPSATINPSDECNYSGSGGLSGFVPVDANGNATITVTAPPGGTPGAIYEFTNLTVQAYGVNGLASPSITWTYTSGNTVPLLYVIRVSG